MLIQALSTARDLGRLHEIASVLVRHGFGDVVQRLGLAGAIERAGRAVHWKRVEGLSTKEPQVRVREALEELGPTYVKLGQILAGRSDLLPPEWTRELGRLQEHAGSVPYDAIRDQLLDDLGCPPEEAFAELDPEPLAAGSIAQVHRARLQDGTPVVLKVRRPGIEEVVEADLRLVARIARTAEREMPEVRRYRPAALARQFARSLRNELDLRLEAGNAERMAARLSPEDGLVVPRVHDEWTRERLCVLDLLEGLSLGEWMAEGRGGAEQRSKVARKGADAVLRMIFVDGFFHADPHPGNVLLLEGERSGPRLGLLDFGMVGHLSDERRSEFLRLVLAVVEHRVETVVDVLLDWAPHAEVDVDGLTADCAAFIDRYDGVPLGRLDVTEFLTDVMGLIRDNDLLLPNDIALLIKVFVTLESLGRSLDPTFVMADRIEPFARAAWKADHAPLALLRTGALEVTGLLAGLPRDARKLIRLARRGKLRVDVDVENLDRFTRQLDHSANRMTMGLIAAALIVGTSVALTVESGPTAFGLPFFGFLGFASSIVVGLGLIWSILRSARS